MCIYKLISYSYSPKLWGATSTWENILLALNQFSLLWMVTQALVSIWHNSCKHHYLSVILIYIIIIHIVFESERHVQLLPRVLQNYKFRLLVDGTLTHFGNTLESQLYNYDSFPHPDLQINNKTPNFSSNDTLKTWASGVICIILLPHSQGLLVFFTAFLFSYAALTRQPSFGLGTS